MSDGGKLAKLSTLPLKAVDLPDGPWKKLAVGIVGPIEQANYRFSIMLINDFSKWPEERFTAHVTTSTVTSFLVMLLSPESYPEDIVTNNGPRFTSNKFRDFLRAREIRHTFVAIEHSQANDLFEHFN